MAVIAVGMLMLASLQAEDIPALAEQAGVEAIALHGAVNSTGLPPLEYLYMTGELSQPRASAPVAPVWDRLAGCESTHNWAANTGNGYYGGLQFDRQTWLAYGGSAYAPTANLATRAQQVAVAERLRAARGFQPWPACSRRLGLLR